MSNVRPEKLHFWMHWAKDFACFKFFKTSIMLVQNKISFYGEKANGLLFYLIMIIFTLPDLFKMTEVLDVLHCQFDALREYYLQIVFGVFVDHKTEICRFQVSNTMYLLIAAEQGELHIHSYKCSNNISWVKPVFLKHYFYFEKCGRILLNQAWRIENRK